MADIVCISHNLKFPKVAAASMVPSGEKSILSTRNPEPFGLNDLIFSLWRGEPSSLSVGISKEKSTKTNSSALALDEIRNAIIAQTSKLNAVTPHAILSIKRNASRFTDQICAICCCNCLERE